MFEVNAVLLMSEIVLEPSVQELQNTIVTATKDYISRLRIFTRWMNGTCIACPLVEMGKQFKYNYTYYEDVIQIKSIVDLVINIHDLAVRVAGEARTFVAQYVDVIFLTKENEINAFYPIDSESTSICGPLRRASSARSSWRNR